MLHSSSSETIPSDDRTTPAIETVKTVNLDSSDFFRYNSDGPDIVINKMSGWSLPNYELIPPLCISSVIPGDYNHKGINLYLNCFLIPKETTSGILELEVSFLYPDIDPLKDKPRYELSNIRSDIIPSDKIKHINLICSAEGRYAKPDGKLYITINRLYHKDDFVGTIYVNRGRIEYL